MARVTARRAGEAPVAHDVQLVPGRGTRWLAVGRATRDLAPAGAEVSSAFIVAEEEDRPTVRLRWRDSVGGVLRTAEVRLAAA
ncbi:hypothetical protein RDV89_02720 [Nocardioides zeae]|uniref:Uncharacterized protein n=1 Tax=Nocardioides imazamoxiresistens TaxID=3231893 RepID=A0ABU3PRV2_9ACTN|nr:hypothetical protein [Nocardioides zeae]MDT9591962.1 hypothetical protein [Nocardioides zeae]